MVQVTMEVNPPINYVEAMRDFGWSVKFHHIRPVGAFFPGVKPFSMSLGEIRNAGAQASIIAYGGKTICSAKKTMPDGGVIEVRAEAKCNDSDKYVKRIGNELSSRRLWEYICA